MTTFTTEDRILAEKDGSFTINVEGGTITPIAYINVEERKLEWAKPTTWQTPTIAKMDKIPLYTHPVKELTDFEIKGVMALDECWIGEDCSMPNMIEFARAILRKAQEK
jgi:hypothetical protein